MFLYVSWTYQFIDIRPLNYNALVIKSCSHTFHNSFLTIKKKKKNQQMQDWGFQFVS